MNSVTHLKHNTKRRKIKTEYEKSTQKCQIMPFPFELSSCKRSFTTRNVELEKIKTLINGDIKPKAGDLVLCEVIRLRQHCRIEQPNGRRNRMFSKDKIIVCYGNRYAPDQFESIVPESLEACHLVAGGGIASLMRHKSPKVKPATEIQPLGLLGDAEGRSLNLSMFSCIDTPQKKHSNNIPILMVAGSSMNAGKTTTAANIVKGLKLDGYKVGVAKVTGTGSGCDLWHFQDAGADKAIDFTDAGFVSTYMLSDEQLLDIFHALVDELKKDRINIIVIEVADGIRQKETQFLLENLDILKLTSGMIYTSGDSISALYGDSWLRKLGYQVMAISGVVSSNPLACREINKNTITPVISKGDCTKPGFGHQLMNKFECEETLKVHGHS